LNDYFTNYPLNFFLTDLFWKIFNISHILIYTEYFTFLLMLLTFALAFSSGIKLFQRSVARALTISFFQDYPDKGIGAFLTAKLSDAVDRLLSNLGTMVASPSVARATLPAHATTVKIIVSAVESKVQRNLHKFNAFQGPIYPSHGLDEGQIVKYRYVLGRLKEPAFLYEVRDGILEAMKTEIEKLRFVTPFPKTLEARIKRRVITKVVGYYVYMICRKMLNA
jgi:hypothetical protein